MEMRVLKDAKTAWLGEFPEHWEVLRIKNLFQEMDFKQLDLPAVYLN